MSPPDSGQNSSDDEGITLPERDRGRKLDNLAELQAAIEQIEQERELSPVQTARKNMVKNTLKVDVTPRESRTLQLPTIDRPPLSKEARKISHSRSATETDAYLPDINRSHSYSPPGSSSDSEIDEEAAARKPPMLRKKSGELVRPALRPPSARRRPSSMPGTPTFGKAVHFSHDLEHVRHFLQVDKPLAVSAETSPVEQYESETEFPFQPSGRSSQPLYEWEIRLANFPADMSDKPSAPIKVERVFLSPDKKTLIGTIAVQNLAFHKTVNARFTFDYWKTTSEVGAEYSHDVRRQVGNDGLDRFNFQIRLADQVNLENKTLFFCVRYLVGGQEYWDSNNSMNYQVDFNKKLVPAKANAGSGNDATRRLSGLPRSRSPQQPQSKKANFDDFGRGFDAHWDKELLPRSQSASSILHMDDGSAPIKFRNKSSAKVADVSGRKQPKGPSQAFGHRYDFGASLSAAITAASTALGDRSGLPAQASTRENPVATSTAGVSAAAAPAAPVPQSTPVALASIKPAAQSQSYNELLEKYCFFGSAKGSPSGTGSPMPACAANGRPANITLDGAQSMSSTPSPAQTPPQSALQASAGQAGDGKGREEISSRAMSTSHNYPYSHQLGGPFPASAAIHG